MKTFNKYALYTLFSLTTFCVEGAFFDSVKCLPPSESGEQLFPRCKEIYGNVEFLYWTAEEGALDYSISQREADWAPLGGTDHFASGRINRATFDWNPGVRLLIGFYNAPKYWELFAQYTYFQNYGHDHAHQPEEGDLLLSGTFPQLTDNYQLRLVQAKSYISLNYQVMDVMFARVFDPNPHLRMRLLAGVTGAFIDQVWKVRYVDNQLNSTFIRNEWRFNSGGLRLGISADWWWKWSLYFTGKASIAGYVGRYTNHSKINTDFELAGHDNRNDVQNIRYKDCRFAQHLQLLLGPTWQCIDDCYHWEFFVGYEFNGWLNLQEVYRSRENSLIGPKYLYQSTSALALQGMTMRFTLGF